MAHLNLRNFMLLLSPVFYYENIRKRFANSYLAEDATQAIIGIDCDYISDESDGIGKILPKKSSSEQENFVVQRRDFSGLASYFATRKNSSIAPFAELFGVLGYECVSYFERIDAASEAQYRFPNFIYADARAYLHFDKASKIYTFYGDRARYYDFLTQIPPGSVKNESRAKFKIISDLKSEKSHFLNIVARAKEYIGAGDIFQVVLSEQLKLVTDMDSLKFYEILSRANPSPYMFHFPTPYGDVVGSSPELVFEIKGGKIFVAPIAGTRARGADANEDERLKSELLSDEKELSEHKMLIDLARNDIGRVAKTGSVTVRNALNVVKFESVMHIVSEIYGLCGEGVDAFSAAASIFPAGTLSGAPKIRAMQIIGELESFRRNAYGGGIGFLHFNGDAQTAILIRSAIFIPKGANFRNADENLTNKTQEKTQRNSACETGANLAEQGEAGFNGECASVFIQAGAGIVFGSVAEREYDEICHKRASVLNVFKKHCEEIK